jgi:hypothetical protein
LTVEQIILANPLNSSPSPEELRNLGKNQQKHEKEQQYR